MQCPKCGYKSTAREDAISPEQCPSCGIYIVLQPGQTEEVERVNIKSLRERFVVNVTLVTSKRDFAPLFRAGRLAVKSVTHETSQKSKASTLPLSNKKEAVTASAVNELITAKLLSKGFDDEGYRSEITLKLLFENKTGRNIQAFEGILRLEDLLGNNVKNVRITINDATWNGTELAWEGAMRFNKFKDDDQKFRSISEDSLKAQFDVVKILYQDGEMLEI